LKEDASHLRKVFANLSRLAPIAIYVAERNLSQWFFEAGYDDVLIVRVRKRENMCRIIHICKKI
jgi:hypothetical protein